MKNYRYIYIWYGMYMVGDDQHWSENEQIITNKSLEVERVDFYLRSIGIRTRVSHREDPSSCMP